MNWRGTTSPPDRIFACLVYVLPLLDVIALCFLPLQSGSFLTPLFDVLASVLGPLLALYFGVPFLPLIIFFALYLLVVRNESIAHFIRFNAMQAILFGILLSLVSIIWRFVLAAILGSSGILVQTLFNTIFLATVVAVGYSIVQSALGRYAEIPTISEAAYAQVR